MTIDPDEAGKWVGSAILVVIAAAKFLRERWEKSSHVVKAKKLAEASIDVGKALLDNDKAHLEELDNLAAEHKVVIDQYEVRELNLTAEKSELLRQNAENARLHETALAELRADRAADRDRMRRLESTVADLGESVETYKRLHEGCELRITEVNAANQKARALDQAALRALRTQVTDLQKDIDDANRRGYRDAKKVETLSEKATGEKPPHTATDVWPEGKPLP